jgi:hypothetical protein
VTPGNNGAPYIQDHDISRHCQTNVGQDKENVLQKEESFSCIPAITRTPTNQATAGSIHLKNFLSFAKKKQMSSSYTDL